MDPPPLGQGFPRDTKSNGSNSHAKAYIRFLIRTSVPGLNQPILIPFFILFSSTPSFRRNSVIAGQVTVILEMTVTYTISPRNMRRDLRPPARGIPDAFSNIPDRLKSITIMQNALKCVDKRPGFLSKDSGWIVQQLCSLDIPNHSTWFYTVKSLMDIISPAIGGTNGYNSCWR